MIKMILFDRDDTLITVPQGEKYLSGNDEIRFCNGAVCAVKFLNRKKILIAVITNQKAVALKEYPHITLESVRLFHDRVQALLKKEDAWIDRFYFCPHEDRDNCECRKPKSGLVLKALDDFSVSCTEAILIGDTERDIAAAKNAGVAGYLFDREKQHLEEYVKAVLKMQGDSD